MNKITLTATVIVLIGALGLILFSATTSRDDKTDPISSPISAPNLSTSSHSSVLDLTSGSGDLKKELDENVQRHVAGEMQRELASALNEEADYAGFYLCSDEERITSVKDAKICIKVVNEEKVRQTVESINFTHRLDRSGHEYYELLPIQYLPADRSLAQLKTALNEMTNLIEPVKRECNVYSLEIDYKANGILILVSETSPVLQQLIEQSGYADFIAIKEEGFFVND